MTLRETISQIYTDPPCKNDPRALPDIEVFYVFPAHVVRATERREPSHASAVRRLRTANQDGFGGNTSLALLLGRSIASRRQSRMRNLKRKSEGCRLNSRATVESEWQDRHANARKASGEDGYQ